LIQENIFWQRRFTKLLTD